jgi:hypothetical protein
MDMGQDEFVLIAEVTDADWGTLKAEDRPA